MLNDLREDPQKHNCSVDRHWFASRDEDAHEAGHLQPNGIIDDVKKVRKWLMDKDVRFKHPHASTPLAPRHT